MYDLDIGKWVEKNWHTIFYVTLIKKEYIYHRDENDLRLWQEDPLLSPEYEFWDCLVGKVTTILDLQQIHGRGKQYKCLMHGHSPYEHEWINAANLPHLKPLMKSFEAKMWVDAKPWVDAKVGVEAKATNKIAWQSTTYLVDGNDIVMEDANTTWQILEAERKDKVPGNGQSISTSKPKYNKH